MSVTRVVAVLDRVARLADEARANVALALRGFIATPTAVAVAVLSLALGIGANTAIFSIIDSLQPASFR